MTPQVAQAEEKLEKDGVVSLSRSEMKTFFDLRARRLVKKSGKVALKTIRSGKCGPEIGWSELTLLSAFLK